MMVRFVVPLIMTLFMGTYVAAFKENFDLENAAKGVLLLLAVVAIILVAAVFLSIPSC